MTLQNYFAPKSVKEAMSLLSEYGQKARVISGGTDLLMQMKHREVLPEYVISIGGIAELSFITDNITRNRDKFKMNYSGQPGVYPN